ncbi:MAG: InlB B-repeat-containing protein [Candidatus Saccharibacteria bacterium]|nr:InlB B-repeat-containing protein [Candidatus Saccharibacteria bacterium]
MRKWVNKFIKVLMVFLPAVFAAVFCSAEVFAETTVTISNNAGGKVSFGKILPSSTGTVATGQDTLTITTNCAEGVNLYVSAVNGGSTALTNAATSSSIPTVSASIGETAAALSSNTWGLNITGGDTYYGLPAYSANPGTPLYTGTATSLPIYYGVKVTSSSAPGSYTGQVLYTAMVNSECLKYTVHFDANGGTGTMTDQKIAPAVATALTANSFERDGYKFLGWATQATGKTGTAVNGVGTAADVDYADEAAVTDLAASGETANLYAIWEQDGYGEDTMQGWTGCSSLAANASVMLTDVRDSKQYAVKKLPDGKCWMMQNLTIGSTVSDNSGLALTSSDTNIPAEDTNTYYLPPAGKQGTGTITQVPNVSGTPGTANFTSDATIDAHAKTRFRTKNASYTNDSDTGYYNFYTATLGYSYYNDGIDHGTSTRDICPANWHLPHTPNTTSGSISSVGSDNDFTYLVKQYGSSGWSNSETAYNYRNNNSTVKNKVYLEAASPLATNTANNNAGFSYSGYWDGTDGSASFVGSYGFYWSASVFNTDSGYYLSVNSSYVYPQYYYDKYRGFAVRCVRS